MSQPVPADSQVELKTQATKVIISAFLIPCAFGLQISLVIKRWSHASFSDDDLFVLRCSYALLLSTVAVVETAIISQILRDRPIFLMACAIIGIVLGVASSFVQLHQKGKEWTRLRRALDILNYVTEAVNVTALSIAAASFYVYWLNHGSNNQKLRGPHHVTELRE